MTSPLWSLVEACQAKFPTANMQALKAGEIVERNACFRLDKYPNSWRADTVNVWWGRKRCECRNTDVPHHQGRHLCEHMLAVMFCMRLEEEAPKFIKSIIKEAIALGADKVTMTPRVRFGQGAGKQINEFGGYAIAGHKNVTHNYPYRFTLEQLQAVLLDTGWCVVSRSGGSGYATRETWTLGPMDADFVGTVEEVTGITRLWGNAPDVGEKRWRNNGYIGWADAVAAKNLGQEASV